MVTASWDTDPFPKVDASLVSPQKAPLHLCSPASPCRGLQRPHPPYPPPHSHPHTCVCLLPWHPAVLARNSTPIPNTPGHSLSPSLLSAWPCPHLIHPLVGCQHMPCPVGCQEGRGTGSPRCQKTGPRAGLSLPRPAPPAWPPFLHINFLRSQRWLQKDQVSIAPLSRVAGPSLEPQSSEG